MSRRLALVLGVVLLTVFLICAVNIFAPVILVLLAVPAYFKYRSKIFIIIPAAALCAFLFCAAHSYIIEKPVLNYADKICFIKAEIKKVHEGLFFTGFDLQVIEIDGKKFNGFKKFNISITVYEIIDAETGDIFEGYISFNKLYGEQLNINKSQGIFIAAELAETELENQINIIRTNSRGFAYYINSLQVHVREAFFKNIKSNYHDRITQEAALTYGVFTGIKSYINSGTINYFRRTGASHVLAVSGLHLSILAGIFAFILKLFNINKKISGIFIILFSLSFAGFAGFTMSAVRAAIMIILFYSAFLLERKSDSITSLLIAGFLIILPNPYHSINIGFQLSFCATFGIVFTQDLNYKINGKIKAKILKIIFSSGFVTLAAVIFTLPVTVYNFQALSLVSIPANFIVSPFITAVLFLALMLSLFSFTNINIILEFLGWVLYHCVRLLINICKFISSFEFAYIAVDSRIIPYFHVLSVIFLFLCVLLILFYKRNKVRKYLYIFTSLVFILLCAVQVYPRIALKNTARFAYYSDYRNQNIVLFHQKYNYADIIDMTHGTGAPVYETYNIIKSNGAVNINSIILTHYHRRHQNMIDRYANYTDIKKVYVPEILNEYDAEVYNSLYFLSQRLGFELLNYGKTLKLGDILISRGIFDYNKMLHFSVDINYRHINLLYLGIGYEPGYRENTPDIFDINYDIIFYGSHKHNFRDDDYIGGVRANFAGVLSKYITRGGGEESSTRFEREILDKYIEHDNLYYSSGDFYSHMVFEVDKNGNIKKYFKR